MEVKINREIRNYTEADFFCLCACGFGWRVLPVEAYAWYRNHVLDLHYRSSSVCSAGLCQIQRNDRREIHCRLGEIRISYPQKADIQINEYLLRADEARN